MTPTAIEQPEEQEVSKSYFCPFDNIIPQVCQLPTPSNMRDSITVHQILVPPPISQPIRQASQGTKPVVPPPISNKSRRSQRISKPTTAADDERHYALLAGEVEDEPETLTEGLSGSQKAEW